MCTLLHPEDGTDDCSVGNLGCENSSTTLTSTDTGDLCGHGEDAQLYPTCLAVTRITVQMLEVTDERKEANINYQLSEEILQSLEQAKHIKFTMALNTPAFVGSANISQSCLKNNGYTNHCIQDVLVMHTLFKKYLEFIPFIPSDPTKLQSSDVWSLIEYSPEKSQARNRNIKIGELLNSTGVHNFTTRGWTLENFEKEKFNYILPNITNLDLSGNEIVQIPRGEFFNAPNLQFLNMSRNSMTELPLSLGDLRSLTHIDMSHNRDLLSRRGPFELIVFGELTKLKWLDLSYVKIKNISFLDTLLNPSNYDLNNNITLKELHLKNCGIQEMDDDTIFNSQKLLSVLDISDNNIKRVPSKTFSSLSNLNYLNLANNKMELIQCLHLPHGKTVNEVDLSYNKFKTPHGIISKGSVKDLNLSHNNISRWSTQAAFLTLDNTPVAKNVNLSSNVITKTSKEMGKSIDVLESIDLGDNKFDCEDCHTIGDFHNWLKTVEDKQDKVQIYDLGRKIKLVCETPDKVARQLISQVYIDFDVCLNLTNYGIVVGIPLAVVAALLIVLGGITYKYRFEATYLIQHFKIKRRKPLKISDPGKFEYDVFVCYSRNDRDWVTNELCAELEEGEDKYVMRLHERDFPLGTMILENVAESMNECRFTIAVLSNSFVKSQWCRWELEMANYKLFQENREFLILLELERLNRSEIPRHLKYLVETRTYLEWPEDPSPQDKENLWIRLRATLGESNYQRSQQVEKESNPEYEHLSEKQIELHEYNA